MLSWTTTSFLTTLPHFRLGKNLTGGHIENVAAGVEILSNVMNFVLFSYFDHFVWLAALFRYKLCDWSQWFETRQWG